MAAPDTPQPPQGLRTSRIESFSDGVFAVVITIMVFSIQLPSLPPDQVDSQLTQKMFALWPVLVRYVITFIAVGMYWVAHNHLFHFIRSADRAFLWLNILFLMFVALLPLPAAIIGQYPTHQPAEVVYGLNLAVIGLCLFLMWHYATRSHRLVDTDLSSDVIRSFGHRILILPAICALAIAFSFWHRRISVALYILMVLWHIFPGRVDRHIRTTALLVLLLVNPLPAQQTPAPPADLVLLNARVWTAEKDHPFAEAAPKILLDTRVLSTILGGRIIYSSGP